MECSGKLSDSCKAAFEKIEIENVPSPFIRLVLKILAMGYDVRDLSEYRTIDVLKEMAFIASGGAVKNESLAWIKPLARDVLEYIDKPRKRIGEIYFFSAPIGRGSEKQTKKLEPYEFFRTIYLYFVRPKKRMMFNGTPTAREFREICGGSIAVGESGPTTSVILEDAMEKMKKMLKEDEQIGYLLKLNKEENPNGEIRLSVDFLDKETGESIAPSSAKESKGTPKKR